MRVGVIDIIKVEILLSVFVRVACIHTRFLLYQMLDVAALIFTEHHFEVTMPATFISSVFYYFV